MEHARWSFANDDFMRGGEEELLKIRRRTAAKTKNEAEAGARGRQTHNALVRSRPHSLSIDQKNR